MYSKITGESFTFDDVLLLPAASDVLPSQIDTRTRLTRRVGLNIPLVSAAMDTVTEARLAIALAQEGGIGIIHKNLDIAAQVREVTQVKRAENGVITDPVCLAPDADIDEARRIMREQHISGIPIVEGGHLVGILTNRDLRFLPQDQRRVGEIMTRPPLVTAPPDTTLEAARAILQHRKVEKLLLVDAQGRLHGLITIKDIRGLETHPRALKDARGRLRVGAAVGVGELERARALAAADVDVLVVDSAHGHARAVIETVRALKSELGSEVIAGNVATAAAVRDLAEAGADGLKVGIGPGSICTTRIVAGVGVPQISAVLECAAEAERHGLPVIADGGIRHSGDATKALAAGASAVMLGGLFAAVVESPGEVVYYQGRASKAYRGMGSHGAMVAGSKTRYFQGEVRDPGKLVPEGVEGLVPLRGSLADFVYQFVGGIRAGMGYCGTPDISSLQQRGRFVRISSASLAESHPHDIVITKEAPNYSLDCP